MRPRRLWFASTSLMLFLMCPVASHSQTGTIAEFSGNGIQNTRPFQTAGAWEVGWDSAGDLFQIYVHRGDGSLAGVAANQQGPGQGSSFQPEAGTYYLQVNAIGNWSIRVSEAPATEEAPGPGEPLFADQGNGAKSTRPFRAPGGWEVTWNASGDLFQIYVFTSDGSLVGVAANQLGPGQGSSYQPQSGEFYLQVNASGDWQLEVNRVP